MPKKVDTNQKEIVEALRACGFSVVHLHAVGKGCPDLIAGRLGVNYLIEIKSAKGKLTPAQVEFHDNWMGQVIVVRSVEDLSAIL
jgi:Holliday junction resolvase